mgnify:CR=1 FL=1
MLNGGNYSGKCLEVVDLKLPMDVCDWLSVRIAGSVRWSAFEQALIIYRKLSKHTSSLSFKTPVSVISIIPSITF